MPNLSFEWKIGLRYLKPYRQRGFISIISFITLFTICLGVAALIIVLSVMNGFQKEIREHLLSTASHIEVSRYSPRTDNWQKTVEELAHWDHVVAAAPFVNGQGLLSHRGNLQSLMVRGVEPFFEKQVIDRGWKMVQRDLTKLQSNQYGIILGQSLADTFHIKLGQRITLIVPQGMWTPFGVLPRFKDFKVVGFFAAKIPEYDHSFAAIHLTDAQTLFRLKNQISGIRLRLDDPLLAPLIKSHLLQSPAFSNLAHVTDWTDVNSNYFRAVQIEKRMMLIILSIIIVVASFGLVSTLYMMVNEKRADIAILRTLGASPKSIMSIFIIQGMATGIFGILSGVLIGVVASLNIGAIERFIELLFGVKILEKQIYFVDYLPSDIQGADIGVILIIALVLSFLATLYPSLSAARTPPSEALRYE